MKRVHLIGAVFGSAWLAAGSLLILGTGCASVGGETRVRQAGAQLWAANCQLCHNVRSPGSMGHAQWEIALHHMRIRANLTADEYGKILEFLRSAS